MTYTLTLRTRSQGVQGIREGICVGRLKGKVKYGYSSHAITLDPSESTFYSGLRGVMKLGEREKEEDFSSVSMRGTEYDVSTVNSCQGLSPRNREDCLGKFCEKICHWSKN